VTRARASHIQINTDEVAVEHGGAHDDLPNEFELPVSLNEQSDGAAIVHGLNNILSETKKSPTPKAVEPQAAKKLPVSRRQHLLYFVYRQQRRPPLQSQLRQQRRNRLPN
jgi:hypothetical protein